MKQIGSVLLCLSSLMMSNVALAKNLYCNEFDKRWIQHEQLDATDMYDLAKHAQCLSKHAFVDADPSVIRRGIRYQSVIDDFNAKISLLVRTLEPFAERVSPTVDAVDAATVLTAVIEAENTAVGLPLIYFEMMYAITSLKLGAAALFNDSARMRRAAGNSHSTLLMLLGQAEHASEYVLSDAYPHITWQSMDRRWTPYLRGKLQAYGEHYSTNWYKCPPKTWRWSDRDCVWDYDVPGPWYISRQGRDIEEVMGGPVLGYEYGTQNIRHMRRVVSAKIMDFRRRVSKRIRDHVLTPDLINFISRLHWVSRTG